MVFLWISSQLLLLIRVPRCHCQPYSIAGVLVGQVPIVALLIIGIGFPLPFLVPTLPWLFIVLLLLALSCLVSTEPFTHCWLFSTFSLLKSPSVLDSKSPFSSVNYPTKNWKNPVTRCKDPSMSFPTKITIASILIGQPSPYYHICVCLNIGCLKIHSLHWFPLYIPIVPVLECLAYLKKPFFKAIFPIDFPYLNQWNMFHPKINFRFHQFCL